jgi:4-amino-4-deoxy-L-arabinose transferase-like glycosyltransferase
MKQFFLLGANASPTGERRFRAGWIIFWVAFLVRVLYMTLAHTYRFHPQDDHFSFGWEMGRIAKALATGHGFANPFQGHTGPTAWVGPLYPLILAGVFKAFGVYTLLSGWVILAFNSFISALTVLTTYEIAARCFNRRVALWSAWIWALYPAAMQYAVRWVWEMTLSTWLLSCILVLALRMRRVGEISPIAGSENARSEPRSLGRWLLFGLLWGLLGLSNPSLLLFLPAAGLWVLRGSASMKREIGYATASGIVFLLCISPWVVRNAMAFHRFIPMRGNFGAEFYLGNGPGANGFLMEYEQPSKSHKQLRLYDKMGEPAYSRMRGRLAWDSVESDPWLFVRNTIKRFYFFWISVPHPLNGQWYVEAGRVLNFAFASVAGLLGLALAWKRGRPAIWLFTWAFVLIPFVYYFVTVSARFRNPLEPLIAILTVYLFQSADRSRLLSWRRADPVDAARKTPVSLEG